MSDMSIPLLVVTLYLLAGIPFSVGAYRKQRREIAKLCPKYAKSGRYGWMDEYEYRCDHGSIQECARNAYRAQSYELMERNVSPASESFLSLILWPGVIVFFTGVALFFVLNKVVDVLVAVGRNCFGFVPKLWTYETAKDIRTLSRNRMEAPK